MNFQKSKHRILLEKLGFLLSLAVLTILIVPNHGRADILYDVDFGTPPHTVGQAPVTNTNFPPRDGPSSINFGNPTVVSDFGLLTDQPLEFNSFDGTGDQIQFTISSPFDPNLPPLESSYTIEADLVFEAVENLFNPFSILIDTPEVRTISFRTDGTVTCFVPFLGCGTDAFGTIGTFTFGTPIHLRIELLGNSWQIFLNDALVHLGPFNPTGGGIFAVRFSMPGGSAAVDNVLICSPSTPGGDCVGVSDTDDDNDGVPDVIDPDSLNPDVCGDIDNDTCDDCAIGTDDLGPASDSTPNNDGPDNDQDGLCDAGDPSDFTIRLLTSATVSAFPDLVPPFLFLPQVGTLMRSNYFYGPGGTLSRTFQRGYMEFLIPPNLPDGFCATLKFREIRGSGSNEVPADLHELSYYLGDGFISTENYDRPKTPFATFETDFNEAPKTVSTDVSSIVPSAQGQILGVEIRLLNNGSEEGSEDPFCFSDGPQSETELIAHFCFVNNPLGSEFCGLDSLCGVDPIDFHPITNPPRIDLDTDCDGILDDVDNCPSVANADQLDTDSDAQGDACDPDDDNDTIADDCDNCQLIANTNQTNTDADQLGDACDPAPFEDVDGICPCGGPLTGGPANACSGPLFSGPWKNHGQYVSCVSHATGTLLAGGKITSSQKDAIVGAAGASHCGGK